MADLNVSLITDLSGKPLPQIYIDALNKMGVTQGDADGNQYVKDKATLDAIIQMHNTIKNAPEADYAGIIDGLTSVKASVEANKPKELQNVKDVDVKAELESIKQSVADNKATNDLILEKLEGTIDTQVTGSNMEQDFIWDEIIESGNMVNLSSDLNLNDYKNFVIYLRPSVMGKFTLSYQLRVNRSAFHRITLTEDDFDVYTNTIFITKKIPIVSDDIQFRLVNNSDEDVSYRMSIYWMT